MSANPIAFVDKVGNVSTHDHSRLRKLLAELPDAPVGEPILALYDATTISQLQAEIARMREALEPFGDVADFMDSETSGFADSDTLHLIVKDESDDSIAAVFFAWPVRLFKDARAALGGSND